MKNRRERAKQVQRRKVAILAAYSRTHTVRNCTIPKAEKVIEKKVPWSTIEVVPGEAEWKIPKEGYPQPKRLKKFPNYEFHPKGISWFMEQVVQHKLAKWEKKNPCPVKQDQNHPDLFEQEYVVPWKAKREVALEHIRDFVVSIYDKLPLTGRFEESDNVFVEKLIAEIKDINGEGHKINKLDPKKSKLLKVAQKKTNEVKAKNRNLVCTNLRDHKRQKGRIILPKAA